jgi:Fe-S-cluster containining protein
MALDSIDRVIAVYFASLCREPFIYKDVVYLPKPLVVSPLIFRDFTCPPACGACCIRVSLDYLPIEDYPEQAVIRTVKFDSRDIQIYSDMQSEHSDYHCKHLSKVDGRCGVYEQRPFQCDFELIRFLRFETQTRLSQQLFGRKWAKKRIDGERGTMCEMTPASAKALAEVIRKLERLKQWIDWFGLATCIDDLLTWVKAGPHAYSLYIPVEKPLGWAQNNV